MNKTILTKEGRKKIQDELYLLNTVEKNRALSEISDARDRGGVEENTEFLIAKEEYEKIQNKINKLTDLLNNSIIVSQENVKSGQVSILSNVKVIQLKSNKEMSFKIVPENEIDIKNGMISPNSPIGLGLMCKKVGDLCEVKTPSGTLEFKIIDIF